MTQPETTGTEPGDRPGNPDGHRLCTVTGLLASAQVVRLESSIEIDRYRSLWTPWTDVFFAGLWLR
jgi:hypothetical protein